MRVQRPSWQPPSRQMCADTGVLQEAHPGAAPPPVQIADVGCGPASGARANPASLPLALQAGCKRTEVLD